MKVLIITAAFPPIRSGGSDYAKRLAKLLADRGLAVTVLTSNTANKLDEGYTVRPEIANWDWADMLEITRAIREIEPDVVDIHFTGWIYNDHPMITFLPSFIRKMNQKIHVSVHIESLSGVLRSRSNSIDAGLRFLISLIVGRKHINYAYGTLIRDCHSLILLNENDLAELCKLVPAAATKSILLPPPPIMPVAPLLKDTERAELLNRFDLKGADPLLAFFGYLYPGKGLETLFRALKALSTKFPDARLALIGGLPEQVSLDRCGRPNYMKDLRELADELQVASRLRFVGYSEPSSLIPSQLLQIADICVLPYDGGVMLNNSSFSFVAKHAKPIITTRSPLTEPVFVHQQNAWIIEPKSHEALASAIDTVFTSDTVAATLTRGAAQLAQDIFNWDKTINSTIQLWQKNHIEQ